MIWTNLFMVDNCINKGSGWVIASKDAEYVNISIFSPFSGSTYIELPHRLRNSMTGLINIKNNANKGFLWCHIRHLNSLKIHPERITKADKNMINDLDYKDIKFPVSGKDFGKIEQKNSICVNVFCYKNDLFYPVYVSDQKFEDCIYLLMITEEGRSHYVYIKEFNRFMCNETKCKSKKTLLQILFTMF